MIVHLLVRKEAGMPTKLQQVPGFKGVFFNHTDGKYYAIVKYNDRHNLSLGPFTSHLAAQDAFNNDMERLWHREHENGRWQNGNFYQYKQSSAQSYNDIIEAEIQPAQDQPRLNFARNFVGVIITADQYFAYIKIPGKKIVIGPFEDIADAAVAHDLELFMLYDEGQITRIAALNFPHTDYPNLPDRIALVSTEYMRELRKKFNGGMLDEEDDEVIEVPAPKKPTSSSAGVKPTQTVATTRLPENPNRFTYANVFNKLGITSVYSGVRKASTQNNNWDVFFKFDPTGKEHYLGTFKTEVAAAERYDEEVHSVYKWLAANRSVDEVNAYYGRFTTLFGVKCNFKKLPSPQQMAQKSSSSSAPVLYQYSAAAASAAESPYVTTSATAQEPHNISPGAKSAKPDEKMKHLRI